MSRSQEHHKFEGWIGHDNTRHMVWGSFEPKPWEETDIEIEVTHCGICSSDIHVLRSGWGPTTYPVVVGHEIIGIAVRVGEDAKTDIRVGDRVGVGAQSDACLRRKPPATALDWSDCKECAKGKENRCAHASTTYNGCFYSAAANGAKTMGGYARYNRCPSHFVFKIPDALRSEHAAPMMCAGLTVYSALASVPSSDIGGLEQHLEGRKIGVVGIGGLGHLAIQLARAMGADYVVGISRGETKRDDAGKLEGLVGSTLSWALPDYGKLEVAVNELVVNGLTISGSLIGSTAEMREMLRLVTEKGIRPWVELRNMKDANQAIMDMEAGKAWYRLVLEA
ncbi:chaperonin 10-like protein [Diplogelasinospora grovesii]|uniref:Chaperonin 10-like protein n=1 Tax=Diplogelasinospora grovesii TaxID=303347 RepID=A0AAN6MU42_9PEZI|nr:chaperonin 10-like protein [Diplogelasinospora grovesii]